MGRVPSRTVHTSLTVMATVHSASRMVESVTPDRELTRPMTCMGRLQQASVATDWEVFGGMMST